MPPDVLEWEDGCLRALSVEDWALEQAMSRDPDVVKWTYYPVEMTEQESRHRIQDSLERTRRGLVRRYAIFNGEDDPVGTCAIGALDDDCPRISYAVLRQGRNQLARLGAYRPPIAFCASALASSARAPARIPTRIIARIAPFPRRSTRSTSRRRSAPGTP